MMCPKHRPYESYFNFLSCNAIIIDDIPNVSADIATLVLIIAINNSGFPTIVKAINKSKIPNINISIHEPPNSFLNTTALQINEIASETYPAPQKIKIINPEMLTSHDEK